MEFTFFRPGARDRRSYILLYERPCNLYGYEYSSLASQYAGTPRQSALPQAHATSIHLINRIDVHIANSTISALCDWSWKQTGTRTEGGLLGERRRLRVISATSLQFAEGSTVIIRTLPFCCPDIPLFTGKGCTSDKESITYFSLSASQRSLDLFPSL